MSTKIEMNYYNGESYEILYPESFINYKFGQYTGTGETQLNLETGLSEGKILYFCTSNLFITYNNFFSGVSHESSVYWVSDSGGFNYAFFSYITSYSSISKLMFYLDGLYRLNISTTGQTIKLEKIQYENLTGNSVYYTHWNNIKDINYSYHIAYYV